MNSDKSPQKYVSLMRLTAKGLAEVTDSASRRKLSEERVAALGGRSIAFYAMLGAYDFLQVFEMPSNEAMMQYVLTARRDGYVEPLILPAFDTETFGLIVNRVLQDVFTGRDVNGGGQCLVCAEGDPATSAAADRDRSGHWALSEDA